jgi:hypothetical protein
MISLGKGEKTMKLTKRGKNVVVVATITVASSLFLSGFAIAKALEPTKVAVVQPVQPAQSTVEKALKVSPSKKLEALRQKPQLTRLELKALLKEVGFEGKALSQAWAIAMRESRGRSIAHNGNTKTGDNSYGLFQINMIGTMGDIRREKFSMVSNAMLLDPVTNAQIAYYMSNQGTDWSAWKGMTPKAKEWLKLFPK